MVHRYSAVVIDDFIGRKNDGRTQIEDSIVGQSFNNNFRPDTINISGRDTNNWFFHKEVLPF